MGVEPRHLRPVAVIRAVDWGIWRSTLRQAPRRGSDPGGPVTLPWPASPSWTTPAATASRSAPATAEWSPVLIDDSVPWVNEYRGLWGLDTRDFLAGELAPAGPKYNRDGSVRQSWYDPLGWAGLDKVTPAGGETGGAGGAVWLALDAELADLEREDLDRQRAATRGLRGLDTEALQAKLGTWSPAPGARGRSGRGGGGSARPPGAAGGRRPRCAGSDAAYLGPPAPGGAGSTPVGPHPPRPPPRSRHCPPSHLLVEALGGGERGPPAAAVRGGHRGGVAVPVAADPWWPWIAGFGAVGGGDAGGGWAASSSARWSCWPWSPRGRAGVGVLAPGCCWRWWWWWSPTSCGTTCAS